MWRYNVTNYAKAEALGKGHSTGTRRTTLVKKKGSCRKRQLPAAAGDYSLK